MKVKKRPQTFEAHRWTGHGSGPNFVTIYSEPSVEPNQICGFCNNTAEDHGQVYTDEYSKRKICPGNWLVMDDNYLIEVYSDDDFNRLYELAEVTCG